MKTIRLFLILTLSLAFSQIRAQIITSNNPNPEPANKYYPRMSWNGSGYSVFNHTIDPDIQYGLVHQSGERIFENEFDHIVNLESENQLFLLFKADSFGIYSTLDSSYSGCIYTDIQKNEHSYQFNFQGRKGFIYDQRERWRVYTSPFLEAEFISPSALSVLSENGYQLVLLNGQPETVIELNSENKIEQRYNFGYTSNLGRDSVRLYVLEANKLKWAGNFSLGIEKRDSLLIDNSMSDLSIYYYSTGKLISEIKTSCDLLMYHEGDMLAKGETKLDKKTKEICLYNTLSGELIVSIVVPWNSGLLWLDPISDSKRNLNETYFVYYQRFRLNSSKTYYIGELKGFEYTPFKKPRTTVTDIHSSSSKSRFPLFWTTQ